MLLALDVGNTNTVLGVFESAKGPMSTVCSSSIFLRCAASTRNR
jgi:pantothenate kinase type III